MESRAPRGRSAPARYRYRYRSRSRSRSRSRGSSSSSGSCGSCPLRQEGQRPRMSSQEFRDDEQCESCPRERLESRFYLGRPLAQQPQVKWWGMPNAGWLEQLRAHHSAQMLAATPFEPFDGAVMSSPLQMVAGASGRSEGSSISLPLDRPLYWSDGFPRPWWGQQQRVLVPVPVRVDAQELQTFREYGESWYRYCKKLEVRFHPWEPLALQPQVTAEARCKLVRWLIVVHRHLNLSFEAYCLAVNILDRFLTTTLVAADCFQLLGLAALLIASKQVEVQPPRVQELLVLCCGTFSSQQLRNLECLILYRLDFELEVPTVNFFLEHFTQVRLQEQGASVVETAAARSLAGAMAELSLSEYTFVKYKPSLLAASCLSLADWLLQHRNPLDLRVSGYSEETLRHCVDELQFLVFMEAQALLSLLPPAVFHKCSWIAVVRYLPPPPPWLLPDHERGPFSPGFSGGSV